MNDLFSEVREMGTELAKVSEGTIIEIEKACQDCSLVALQKMSPIRRTLALANGMQTIRRCLTGPLMADIMALANTPLGFLTDRKPGATNREGKEMKTYPEPVIRDCVIEGMLRGASIVGNEINVIAGRCYLTKAYFERAVREWPGISDLAVTDGVPVRTTASRHVLVPMRAEWRLNGGAHTLRCEATSDGDFRIPVVENEGMGIDAVLGKARRKLFAKIFAWLTGSEWVAEQAELETLEPEPAKHVAVLAAPDEKPPESLPANIAETLTAIEQLTEVDDCESGLAVALTSQELIATLREWCDWRRDEIRASRGQNANPKR